MQNAILEKGSAGKKPAQKLLFVFGRNKLLSMLEIASFLKAEKSNFEILAFSENSALVETEESFKPAEKIRQFGGVLKIARVVFEESAGNPAGLREKILKADFAQEFGKKFYYTLNDYSISENEELKESIIETLKESFKQQKLKAMLKWPKRVLGEEKKSISPKLLSKRSKEHLDLSIFQTEGKVFLCKTVASSNPLEFAERDSKRPVIKPELITSARLARILVNLVMLEKGKTILDPFCGIGSIMQEAMLSGHNALGNDLNGENARACEKNLQWARKKYSLKENFKVFNNDSRKLSNFLHTRSFDAVVTEPYLGPYLRKLPSARNAEQIAGELERLYNQVFKELAKIMQKGQTVVIIFPQFQTIEGRRVKIRENTFKDCGFKVLNILEKHVPKLVPFLYRDKESRIERLIYVLVKE